MSDRRSVMVAITPDGLATAQAVRELIHAREKTWMSVLTDGELALLIGLMHRIQASVEASVEASTGWGRPMTPDRSAAGGLRAGG